MTRVLFWVVTTYATAITLGYTYQLTTISQLNLDHVYQKAVSKVLMKEYYLLYLQNQKFCPRTYTYNPHTPHFYSPEGRNHEGS